MTLHRHKVNFVLSHADLHAREYTLLALSFTSFLTLSKAKELTCVKLQHNFSYKKVWIYEVDELKNFKRICRNM